MTSTNDGLRQATVRAVTGTTLDYDGDWHALFTAAGIAAGTYDERMLAWINSSLSTSYTSLPQAMQALAVANGAYNFSSMGTFTASSEFPTIPGSYNFLKANNTKILAAMTAQKAASDDVRIDYVGNSTVFGQNSSGTGTTNAKVHPVSVQLAAQMNTASIPASADNLWGTGEAGTPSQSMANLLLAEPKLTRPVGTGWDFQSFPCIGGHAFGVSGADTTSTMVFTTSAAVNRCDVYFLQFGSGGNFKFSVDGGAESANQSTNGASGMGKVTLNLGTSAAHAVKFRCTDANVFLIGLEFYDTATRRVVIRAMGACGETSSAMVATSAAWDWGNNFTATGAHLAILECGLINDRNGAPDPSASMANLQTMITAYKAANTDVWLMNPEPVSDSTTVSFAYQAALISLANSNNVTLIDMMSTYQTVSAWNGAGLGDGSDLIHPNQAGYAYLAGRYLALLQAVRSAA